MSRTRHRPNTEFNRYAMLNMLDRKKADLDVDMRKGMRQKQKRLRKRGVK